MKIGRFSNPDNGGALWGVIDLDARTVMPLRGTIGEWAPELTADPGASLPYSGRPLALDALRLLAPLEPTAKVIAAGATYAGHVAGIGLETPKQPSVFLKTVGSIVGPEDEIAYPTLTTQLDYEAELVVVIGAHVSGGGAGAISSILGYTVGNEVSARDLQVRGTVTGMDMFSAKALDRTGPVGPWIVTRDEFGDQSPDLGLELTVNGEVRQQDRTGSLSWGVGEIISYVSERSALDPGDILFTGTPGGVGHEDGRYLEPGQEVVVTIEGIGSLRNVVGARS
jgi:2-keto-4-pentenoate hydratase/2-oxohepta-3-ene-1,7-dioic acid hydratase in catechol pathway